MSAWRQVARAAMARVLPSRLLIVRGPRRPEVCLTFDDGPHPEHTPRLLDALAAAGVVATFFMVGEAAARRPDLVRRVAAAGHAVGSHSYHHGDPDRTSPSALEAEVQRACALLGGILGSAPALFRPPLGKVTSEKLLRLWRARQTVVLWSADPRDYACRSGDEVTRWLRTNLTWTGDIVLMHDTHPHAAQVLPDVAAAARARSITFTTVDRWVQPQTR